MLLYPPITCTRGVSILLLIAQVIMVPIYCLASTAQSDLDSLQRLLLAEQNDSVRVELQIKISRQQHRKDHHEQACVEVATAAVEQAAVMDDIALYAKSMDNLGLLYRYHQYYSESLPLHKRAFDMVEGTDVPPLSKMIYANNTGVAARHNGDFDIAVKYYLKSLSIAEMEGDKKNMEIASNGLGNAFMNLPGREEEALGYFNQAFEIAKESDNKLGQAMNYLSISGYYVEIGKHALAREYLTELRRLNEEMGDKNGMAITYQALGNSFLAEHKDLRTAKSYFEIAKRRFEEIGNETGMAQALYSLGTIHYKNDQLNDGLSYFFKAMEVGKRLNNKNLIQRNAEMISCIYEESRNPTEALRYYKMAQAYKDSIALTDQRTAIAAIKSRYDFERKEQQIELLTKDRQLQEAQLKSSNLVIYLMSGLLALLLGFIFFQVRIRRIRKKATALVEERERDKLKAQYEKSLMEAEMIATRMQVNPHFMFNSLSAIKFMIQSGENAKAMQYLVTFSRFIRSVLETSEEPVHSVDTELQLLANFLKLEENRFDTDFSYHIRNDIHQWADRKVIPALLLQPFVENAIWHGLLPSERAEKTISITAHSDASGIVIVIVDNGVGFKQPTAPRNDGHTSIGHKITDKRIELYNSSFPDHIDWNIEPINDDTGHPTGTRVQVTIRINASVEPQSRDVIQPLITETI